jgi:ankyrin repeat protein
MNSFDVYNYFPASNVSNQPLTAEELGWLEISKASVANSLSLAELKAKYPNPLHASVSLNDLDLCKKILDLVLPAHLLNEPKGISSLSDIDPNSKLCFEAVTNNNLSIVKLLLERGANATNFDFFGDNPVFFAFINRNKEIVKVFIEKGFQLDSEILPGKPLAFMDRNQNSVESMKMALELGADLKHRFNKGMSYLHLAVKNGDLPLCKFLLEAGADIKAVNENNQSVLSMAIRYPSLIPFLLEKEVGAQSANLCSKSIVDWTSMIENLRLMGLRHGIKEKIFEGFNRHFGYEKLASSLEGYSLSEKTAHSIFKTLPKNIACASKMTCEEAISKLEKDEIVTLSCGWHEHETVAILTKKFIILGNQGDGSDNKPGLTLYKINKPENLKKTIKTLIKNKKPKQKAQHLFEEKGDEKFIIKKTNIAKHFFNTKILELLGLESIYHLKKKSQISGNCVWKASEMGLMGNLILSPLQENPERGLDDIIKEARHFYQDWKKYDRNQTFEFLAQAESQPRINDFINLEKIYDELFILNFFDPQALDKLCALRPRLKEWITNPDHKLISYAYQHKSAKLVRKLLEMGVKVDMQAFSSSDDPKLNQVHYDYFFEKWIQAYKTNSTEKYLLHQLCTINIRPSQLLGLLKDWQQKVEQMNEPDLLKNALNTPCALEQGGYTPLLGVIATYDDLSSTQDVVAFMLEVGANPSLEAKSQDTAVHHAVNKVTKREDIEVVRILLKEAGQPIELANKANSRDIRPLDIVRFGEDYTTPLIQILLDAGAEVPTKYFDKDELNSEIMASFVDYYISKGIEKNKPDEDGYTPLYYIVDRDCLLAAKLLESWKNTAEKDGNKDQLRQAIQEVMPNGDTVLDIETMDRLVQEDVPGAKELKTIFLQCIS